MHLTAQQHATYKFIDKYINENNIAPTEAEIAKAIGITSRGVVHRYIRALEKEGLVEILPNRKRNIRILRPINKDFSLPVLGKIAAGYPIEAVAQESSLNLFEQISGEGRFVLEVKGNSMIGDNICDGDYIICETSNNFSNTDIVVILIDGEETTLKRCKMNPNNTITLIPSNPEMEPQIYDGHRLQIQGKYIGLLRLH